MPAILGRDREILVGIESTYGTEASTFSTFRYLDFKEGLTREDIMDESGIGRMEKNSGSSVVRKSSAPTLSLICRRKSIGTLLKGIFRSVSTTANSPETGVHTHTFSVPAGTTPVSYSIRWKDEISSKVITGAVIDSASIQIVQNDLVKVEISFVGKYPVDTTSTPSYVADTAFDGTMATVKLADTISALSSASAICMQDATIEIKNNVKQEDFYCLGSTAPNNAIYGIFEANISLKRVKSDEINSDKFDAGTKQACLVSIVDTGTTVGASTNPSLSFTFAPALLKDYDGSGAGLDDVMVEAFSLEGIYSMSDGKMVSAVLVNDIATI